MDTRFAPILQRQLAIGKQEGLAPIQDAANPAADKVVINPETGEPADPVYRTKATEAAVKFESFFIGHMLHQMRASSRVLQDDGEGHRDKTNDDMLDMADNLVADQMAGRHAFGVADAILRQLLPAAGPAATPDGAVLPLHPAAPAMPLSPQQLPVAPDTKSSSSI